MEATYLPHLIEILNGLGQEPTVSLESHKADHSLRGIEPAARTLAPTRVDLGEWGGLRSRI